MLFNGGKLAGNEQMDRKFMFMKTNNPRGVVCQVYWYISQISGERLQDHWSSGLQSQMLRTDRINNGF